MHVLGSCEASAQYSPINFFVNLFHSKNSNLPHCFSDLIHTEYRKLHKNNGHSPFFLPPIMQPSVGQCRNIRFRQLYASHVIITSDKTPKWVSSLKRVKVGLLRASGFSLIHVQGPVVQSIVSLTSSLRGQFLSVLPLYNQTRLYFLLKK